MLQTEVLNRPTGKDRCYFLPRIITVQHKSKKSGSHWTYINMNIWTGETTLTRAFCRARLRHHNVTSVYMRACTPHSQPAVIGKWVMHWRPRCNWNTVENGFKHNTINLFQATNVRLTQPEEFVEDDFKFDENGKVLHQGREHSENGEIARYEQFLLFPVFSREFFCRHLKTTIPSVIFWSIPLAKI